MANSPRNAKPDAFFIIALRVSLSNHHIRFELYVLSYGQFGNDSKTIYEYVVARIINDGLYFRYNCGRLEIYIS